MQTTSTQSKKFTSSITRFAFAAPTTRQVSLAGDFNNWDTKAAPMHKGPDGIWRLSVPLGPGRYEYRFYADGVWQDDPSAEQRAANGLGTENCVRTVAAWAARLPRNARSRNNYSHNSKHQNERKQTWRQNIQEGSRR